MHQVRAELRLANRLVLAMLLSLTPSGAQHFHISVGKYQGGILLCSKARLMPSSGWLMLRREPLLRSGHQGGR